MTMVPFMETFIPAGMKDLYETESLRSTLNEVSTAPPSPNDASGVYEGPPSTDTQTFLCARIESLLSCLISDLSLNDSPAFVPVSTSCADADKDRNNADVTSRSIRETILISGNPTAPQPCANVHRQRPGSFRHTRTCFS